MSAMRPPDYHRTYRRRQREHGRRDVLLILENDLIDFIDAVQRKEALPNRSAAAARVLQRGMQQMLTDG